MNRQGFASVSVGLLIGALLACHEAQAQTAGGSGPDAGQGQEIDTLQEIVVTAEKRVENLQDVPSSIAVVSADELAKKQVTSVLNLSQAVPGVSLSAPSALYTGVYIRGIGTDTNGYGVEPSVSTVIDGVVMARAGSSLFNFDDLDRVEVLRGPQGTLFGKNSSAGVISMVTKDPTGEFSDNLNVTYGSYHETKVDGAVSGPLIEDILLGRFSFLFDSRDGYIHDVYDGQNYNDNHQQGFRTKLLFKPTDSTRIHLSWDYENLLSNGFLKPVRTLGPTPNFAEIGHYAGFSGFPAGFIGPDNDEVIENHSGSNFAATDSRANGITLQVDQDIGSYTLTSISAYRIWDAFQNQSFNDTPIPFFHYMYTFENQSQESQELRIASPKGGFVDYVAGLFFYRDFTYDHDDFQLDLSIDEGLPLDTLLTDINYASETDSTNYAAFGEANFHFTDQLTLVAGMRGTHDHVSFHTSGVTVFNSAFAASGEDSAGNLSWRIGPRYEFSPDTMAYATVSRGFKGPAYNTNTTSSNPQLAKPEIATSYELGLKSEFLDRRVRTNLALYLTNLKDFQSQGILVLDNIPEQFLTNAGEVRSQGVELEVQATPVHNLAVNLSAAYIDAYYVSYVNAPCYTSQTVAEGCHGTQQNLTGQPTPNTPKFSFEANANYDIVLPGPVNAFVRADYSWKDKVQWDGTNDPLAIEGSVGLLGGSLGVFSKDGRYTVDVYGRNLTNEFHTAGIVITGNGGATSELMPDFQRIWGVEFHYRY